MTPEKPKSVGIFIPYEKPIYPRSEFKMDATKKMCKFFESGENGAHSWSILKSVIIILIILYLFLRDSVK